jgi:hypothetical protein
LRSFQMKVGQALREHYELPEELPHGILTLLMQLRRGEWCNRGQRMKRSRLGRLG